MKINYSILTQEELCEEIKNSINSIEVVTKREVACKIDEDGKREIDYVPGKNGLTKYFNEIQYINIASAFDTETSSITLNGIKCGTMYAYGFGYNGSVSIGRTWKEFVNLLIKIKDILGLNETKRLVVYVHNLSFEFQFMRKYLDFIDVFSVSSRKIVRAVCREGFEFRCTYIQSGYSLDNLKLKKYDVRKLVGQCNYSLIRHSATPLTNDELNYLRNDVLKCMAYIDEKIDEDGDVTKILLTKTGYVRSIMRKACLNGNAESSKSYRSLMKKLRMSWNEYSFMKKCFCGGFTHANAYHSGEKCKNVESLDITSDYPTVMVSEKFPMSKAEKVYNITTKSFEKYINIYSCMFEVVFANIRSKVNFDHPISESKCEIDGTAIIDNGRVVQVNGILTTKMTDVDWKVISKYYEWDAFEITEFYRFKKDYLPKAIIDTVLYIYNEKTKLKGVKGSEYEYALMKELLNSCYGMMVTDPIKESDEYNYIEQNYIKDEKIETKEQAIQKILNNREKIEDYNNSYNRFIFYGWGVWIAAYARSRLLNAIYECGEDHRYSDTDSEKCVNYEKHKEYFEKDNNDVDLKLYLSSQNVGWDIKLSKPKNIKGVTKPLGHWDDEGKYDYFTSLGAKRYIYVKNNGKESVINATVAGIPKVNMCNYLVEENKSIEYFNENEGIIVNDKQIKMAFEKFKDDLSIDSDSSGKKTHTYTDIETSGWVTDYLGNKYFVDDKSSVFISPTSFDMKLSEQYKDYMLMIKGISEVIGGSKTIIN